MSNKHGVSVSKPISAWNKDLKVNLKDFFKSLIKTTAQFGAGNYANASKDAVDTISAVKLGNDYGGIAWLLIYRSLLQAVFTLVEENEGLLLQDSSNPMVARYKLGIPPDDPDALINQLDLSLEEKELTIDEQFFVHPEELSILEDFKRPFSQWLQNFGLSEPQSQAIANHLRSYFVFALNDQWRTRSEDYVPLKQAFDTPFTKASEQEQAWMQYSAWLKKQVDESMFDEAFSLSQVYVPLRAYYEVKVDEDKSGGANTEEKKIRRVVIELEETLKAWLDKGDPGDALKVISGGPGSGKSSFTKMFAARMVGKTTRRILFVPLHLFEASDDLVEALGNYIRLTRILPYNPLDPEEGDAKLLLIFDGLDELTMQGKLAAETAQQFVSEIQRKVELLNSKDRLRLKVLISGRDLAVQANMNQLRKQQQVMYVLPYLIKDGSSKNYQDSKNLLEQDQRQVWWKLYSAATGKNHAGMPNELSRNDFEEITSQPLLNFLVALSYDRGILNLTEESNLNRIYEDLLKAVYERKWAVNPHPATLDVQEEDFIRILEEVAVSAWHGDGRKTSVREIEAHCEVSGLKDLLEALQEGASKGVTRLLMAFYFRQAGNRISGDRTFEFTHKSFGEYLTARRLVDVVRNIHNELERQPRFRAGSFNEQLALEIWVRLCGQVPLDEYIYRFLHNEMLLQDPQVVLGWQATLCRLISYMIDNGMPMERITPRPYFKEEVRQARNAEEALLAALNVCARTTKKISEINWPSATSFGEWIARLLGQRPGGQNVLAMECLSYLNLSDARLDMRDLYSARLSGSDLKGAHLYWTHLQRADLSGANLEGIISSGALLGQANLEHTNLKRADLTEADLRRANLFGANLEGAILDRADLTGAQMDHANVFGASFRGAILDSSFSRAINAGEALTERAVIAPHDTSPFDPMRYIRHEGLLPLLEGKKGQRATRKKKS